MTASDQTDYPLRRGRKDDAWCGITPVLTLLQQAISTERCRELDLWQLTPKHASAQNTRLCRQNYFFVPIAVETFGAFGEEARCFFNDLDRRIGEVTKESRSFSFLIQRVSVAIQRGNAACVLGTSSDMSALDDIFVL